MRRADEHVARHAAHVVHHVAEDEAREAAVVGRDLGPAGRPLGRDLAVVDGGAARVVVHHEVAGAGEPGERLVVVAPELVGAARRTAEALLKSVNAGSEFLPWKMTSRSGGASGGTKSARVTGGAPATAA